MAVFGYIPPLRWLAPWVCSPPGWAIWRSALPTRWPRSAWARSASDADGTYSLVVAKPGPVGEQAPHLTLLVFARGLLKPVLTRMYFPDEEEANADDPVLSALEDGSSLVAEASGDGLVFDITLQGDGETVFFAV